MHEHPEIFADPNVMTGMPCIRGTRVTVANILRQIAAGRSADEICRDYPYLTPAAIRGALEFAADVSGAESYELAS